MAIEIILSHIVFRAISEIAQDDDDIKKQLLENVYHDLDKHTTEITSVFKTSIKQSLKCLSIALNNSQNNELAFLEKQYLQKLYKEKNWQSFLMKTPDIERYSLQQECAELAKASFPIKINVYKPLKEFIEKVTAHLSLEVNTVYIVILKKQYPSEAIQKLFINNNLLHNTLTFFFKENIAKKNIFNCIFNRKTTSSSPIEPFIQDLQHIIQQLSIHKKIELQDEYTYHFNEEHKKTIDLYLKKLQELDKNISGYTDLVFLLSLFLAADKQAQTAIEYLQNTDFSNFPEEALVYYNLFILYLREKQFDIAQQYLEKAITIEPQYAFHDIEKYPIKRILSVSFLGCAFLCEDKQRHLLYPNGVIVKSFWQPKNESFSKTFQELVLMDESANHTICKTIDYGFINDKYYIVTQYFHNADNSLDYLNKYGTISYDELIHIGFQFIETLHFAHSHHIVHTDLKPSDLLLKREQEHFKVFITDFGQAALGDILPSPNHKNAQSVVAKEFLNTIDYLAPEIKKHQPTTQKVDIYSFGAIMYYLVTQESPAYFRRRKLPDIPALQDIIEDCLEPDPMQRPDAQAISLRWQSLLSEQLKQDLITNNYEQPHILTLEDEKTEETLWENVEKMDTTHAYKHYLKTSKLKKYVKKAKDKLLAQQILEEEESLWKQAQKENTVAAYQGYLQKSTQMRYSNDAKQHISILEEQEEDNAWIQALNEDTVDSYQKYLDNSKLLHYKKEAEKKLLRTPAHTLEGHIDQVSAVDINKDNTIVISASFDKTIRLWDIYSGKTLKLFKGHESIIHDVCFSGNNQYFTSASADKTIKLWDIEKKAVIKIFTGHNAAVYKAKFINSKQILSCSADDTIRVWNIATGETDNILRGHVGEIYSIAISKNGKTAISSSSDNTIRIWSLETGKTLKMLTGHQDEIFAIDFCMEKNIAISGSGDNKVKIWNIEEGKTIHTLDFHTSRVKSVALTPDGKYALSGSWDKTLCIWEVTTGKLLRVIKKDTGLFAGINDIAITSDSKIAISANFNQILQIWPIHL